MRYFGAIWEQGVGMQGQSYAIPTMHGGIDVIKPYVDQFIAYAREHQDKVFYVTRIGCGIAGFKDEDIAPLFVDCLVHLLRSPSVCSTSPPLPIGKA